MSNVKSKIPKRLLAAFLSLMMVFSMTHFSTVVHASTTGHPDAVTISVIDENGQAIKGATVAYTVESVNNGDIHISETKTTDEYGVVDVFPSSEFDADDILSISAEVTATGFETKTLPKTVIKNAKDNITVYLMSTTINDVTIQGRILTYNGNPQYLVDVTEVPGDTITYEFNGKEIEEKPKAIDAGTYKIKVTVSRSGKEDLVREVTTVINPANIKGIDITANQLKYNEEEQKLVSLTGSFLDNDIVTWEVNGTTTESRDVPKGSAVGNYTVKLTVDRGSNYVKFKKEVNVEIALGEIDLGRLKIEPNDRTYDTTEEDALIVSGKEGNYHLEYRLGEDGEWVKDAIPKIKDAGTYKVYVKATKDNYEERKYPEFPIIVTISKAPQSLEFTDTAPTEVTIDRNDPEKNIYDFHAEGDNFSGNDVEYTLIDATSDDVASISSDGKLTVAKAGIVTVKATRKGNNNYSDANVYKTVIVKVDDKGLVSFAENTINYVLDEDGVASTQTATKVNTDDNGSLTYSIDKTDIGLSIDSATGKITVTKLNKLKKELDRSGKVYVTVTVNKDVGTVTTKEWYFNNILDWGYRNITREVYPSASTTYTLVIIYDEAPDFATTCQITNPGPTGWYNAENPAIVTPIDSNKYSIAVDSLENFSESQTISSQGAEPHYIYFKDKNTKRFSSGVEVNINVDTAKPDTSKMKIEFSELNLIEKIGKTLGFYNPTVTINFTAEDTTSGIDHFDWTYTKESGASVVNKDSITQEIPVTVNGNVATASLTLPADEAAQLHGRISFTATDKANNVSEVKTENYVVIVDTISPTRVVTFTDPVQTLDGNHHYFTGDATFTFTVNEANFYEEDVVVKVSKDGGEPYEVTPTWAHNSVDEHVGTYTLSGDGDYVVYMTYTDKSGNEMDSYQSDIITIDTTKPVVKMDYVHKGDEQKTIFTVIEHNFRPSDVAISGTIQDIKGNAVASTPESLTALLRSADWKLVGKDTYQHVYDGYVDGIYNLKMDYKDISCWDAETYVADEFIIDHTAPEDVSIDIVSTPLKTILSAITFGFYNPDVTVKFTAHDYASGVKSFHWNYTKENGASDINRPTDGTPTTVDAVQDSTDKSKYTASITLPDTEAKQLRGYLAVYTTDAFGNDSKKVTDSGNIIVVDTIAPEVKVEYSKASRTVGTKAYYNGNVDVTITVNEANFYSDDVIVKASKNGGAAEAISPVWTAAADDNHIGQFTLTEDGHYIITVEYKDKSGNFDTEKSFYTSHEITIDTIKPVIKVDYQNKSVINTLKDKEGHERKYFADTQTAVVTITEQNFNADEVDFNIISKDVTGKTLDDAALSKKTAWTVDSTGDVHTITITYPGDANYSFDVDYTDLAVNAAEDYATDYFTVDKTGPENLTVKYSTSMLDTVLESVTFGFYNAKMTVTLTAEDPTSEVHSFLYSYLNAPGVSSVNAELINQVINAAVIKYSGNGKTATATFEIPKMVLGNDNQFNGTVEFTATDRSGNESNSHKETKRIVVDNIAPTAQVSYNEATNVVGDVSYYNGNINATVTINEANFYADDVRVMVSKDSGAATPVTTHWTDKSVDVHVGTFTLTEDGDYIITINYKDKSSNAMATYTSKQLTIDTDIQAPKFSINGVSKTEEGGAYKGETLVAFDFEDQNFDTKTIKLTRTRFNSVEDVTEKFIKVSDKEKGGSGSFTIPSEVENDGIYVLSIRMTDKAKHSIESKLKFTINRFGSVYAYSDYLASLIKDGGQYIKIDGDNKTAITQDLIITEYNANPILTDSLKILITRDGETVDAKYSTNPKIDGNADIGESGWYQYVYTIAKENFAEDGVYKIALTSAYSTSDSEKNESTSVPENSVDTAGNQILDTMSFTVDTKAPEIRNIVNLDKPIVNAQALDVKYNIVDVGGLKTIEVILNGETIDTITDFGDSLFNYSGQFTIKERNDAQTVQIKVTDRAGNVTDTASEDFSTNDLYIFNDTITVSTNFFVRWYANRPLFWGSVSGVVVLISVGSYIITAKLKKKEESNQNA